MIEHYNAFISYKHADRDIKTAEYIERKLEHFHVPRSIRKKTGIRRINHIFRDKDELPITSDLTEQLCYALDHADYLIVVCSKETRTSAWVPREIEYFLRSHTRSQVLTVLVDGEPLEVIPEILLHEDRVLTDEYGNEHLIRVPLEPLSCDFRGKKRNEKNEELNRLASALLSCSYSELMNRQRRYKMHRVMYAVGGVAAIACTFIAYILHSRDNLKRAYRESLANQSRYLASEADYLMRHSQRITAIQLALEALPKDKNDDRPVTPEAVRALTDATLSYVSKTNNNIGAAWNYTMPSDVDDLCVSDNGSYLAAHDSAGIIMVWKTASHTQVIRKIVENIDFRQIAFVDGSTFLLAKSDQVTVFDASNGEELWSYQPKNGFFDARCFLGLRDDRMFLSTSEGPVVLSLSTGDELATYSYSGKLDEFCIPSDYVLSPDGTKLAFTTMVSFNSYTLYVWDLATDKFTQWNKDEAFLRKIAWVDDDRLILAVGDNDGFSSSQQIDNQQILKIDTADILLIRVSDMKELWKNTFSSSNVMIKKGFLTLPKTNSVLYYSGNVATSYDLDTGEQLSRRDTNDPIIHAGDRDGDGYPLFITRGGGLVLTSPSLDPETTVLLPTFADNLSEVSVSDGVYVSQKNSRQIIYYGLSMYDSAREEIGEAIESDNTDYYMDDSVLALITNYDTDPVLILYDLSKDDAVVRVALPPHESDGCGFFHFVGSDHGKLYLAQDSSSGSFELYSVSFEGGAPEKVMDFECSDYNVRTVLLNNGRFFTVSGSLGHYSLDIYDLKDKSKEEHPFECKEFANASLSYDPETGLMLIQGNPYIIFDLNTGSITQYQPPAGWSFISNGAAMSKTGLFAVSDQMSIIVFDKAGEQVANISSSDKQLTGFDFWGDQLLIASSNGYLYRYDARTGSQLGVSTITTSATQDMAFTIDETAGLIYLQNDMQTSVIDAQSMIEVAAIDSCFGHSPKKDRFYTVSYENEDTFRIGYYKHYTPEDLIAKAKDILQEQVLTDEQKVEYGLSDH